MYSEGVFLLSSIATIAAAVVAILWFLFGKREIRGIPTATVTDNNAAASASSSAADSIAGVYEVFLSFCGIDTRKGFTDFLYTYLVGASIRTFRDDNELRVGEEIGPELLKAIKESKISIPIFSKNYAYSKWCLLELAQMVECHKNGGQMIYPIFYDVDPSDVRNQMGIYEKAFCQHKKKFNEDTVQSWREALRMVGQLKGLELKKETDGREGELVKIVVEKVLIELKRNHTHVPKNLVGMDNHIENLKELLKVESNSVRIVGIHGMGGLGKTTIAKVIYNQLCGSFEGHCFLDNVRENSRPRGRIVSLQNQLISKIQNREVPKFNDFYEGSNRIKDTVHGRKVLIVLDDVDENFQIDMLMGNQGWFGAHSRIIITTRDTKVLDAVEMTCQREHQLDVYTSYKLDFMDDHHSLQLFSKYAFMRDSPIEGYDILSEEVVSIAAGLPLVLVVLGSALFAERDKELWEECLRKLRAIPHEKVLEKLRFSFEGLENGHKQIFLDIACLFTGRNKTMPCYMWDDCGFYPREGIRVLVSRSLITVDDDDVLRMHDQLRDLGRQIVREEGLNELGKQSRLWCEEEAMHVLETSQGTSNVNALCLPLEGIRDRCLVAQDFYDLPNLRYISMQRQDLDGDFKHLLSNLRWLQYWRCLGKFKPTNFHLKNLVILDLSRSDFTEDWEGWSQFKMAKKLKVLNLSCCSQLRVVPHLSMFASLEILELGYCIRLCRLDGLEQLKSLRHLNASGCAALETLPSLSNLTKLVEVHLCGCEKLIEIQGLEKLGSLQVLDISRCSSLEKIPTFSNLKKLKTFKANRCYKLIEIEGLQRLNSLEHLDLSFCETLKGVPNLSNLNKLKVLCGLGLKITEIPGLGRLESLEALDLSYHESIERLPDLSNLKMLKKLLILSCDKLIKFQGLDGLEALEDLGIQECGSVKRLLDISYLKRLKRIRISLCHQLIEIQDLGGLESLEKLDMSYCSSIEKLPNLSNLRKLKELRCSGLVKLIEIQGLDRLESLEKLHMFDCASIESLPDLPNFGMLKDIMLVHCDKLHEVEGLGVVESLESVGIEYCNELQEIPDLRSLKNLKKLRICYLKKVTGLCGLEELKSLESLDITGCNLIEALPNFSNLEKLIELDASGCVNLTEICGLEELKSLKKLSINGCWVLENLPNLPNTTIEMDPPFNGDFGLNLFSNFVYLMRD